MRKGGCRGGGRGGTEGARPDRELEVVRVQAVRARAGRAPGRRALRRQPGGPEDPGLHGRDAPVARRSEDLRQKLERSNRELEEFASVASHDLQEPLRKIQAFGDRLQAKYADGARRPGPRLPRPDAGRGRADADADQRPADLLAGDDQGAAVRARRPRPRSRARCSPTSKARIEQTGGAGRGGRRCRPSTPTRCRCGSCSRT